MREENVASTFGAHYRLWIDSVKIAPIENPAASVVASKDHDSAARRHSEMDSGRHPAKRHAVNQHRGERQRPRQIRRTRPARKHRRHEHGDSRSGRGPRQSAATANQVLCLPPPRQLSAPSPPRRSRCGRPPPNRVAAWGPSRDSGAATGESPPESSPAASANRARAR